MKLLLDECVDWRVLRDLSAYDVRTVKQLGWEHVKNGALLEMAAKQFDVFVTVDKDLPHQQNIASLDIAVVILTARTTRLADLQESLPRLHETLSVAKSGQSYIVSWRDAH